MAHNEPTILGLLVSKLKKDVRNDVFVHIDKKVKKSSYKQLERSVLVGGGVRYFLAAKVFIGVIFP